MHWNQIHPKLRILNNAIAISHTSNNATTARNEADKAWNLMEELTKILNDKEMDNNE